MLDGCSAKMNEILKWPQNAKEFRQWNRPIFAPTVEDQKQNVLVI